MLDIVSSDVGISYHDQLFLSSGLMVQPTDSIEHEESMQFSKYRSFTSLVRFIPRYFIFLVAIANGIFS